MDKINIKTSRFVYPVLVGNDTIRSIAPIFSKYRLSKRVFVLIDRKVNALYGMLIRKRFDEWSEKNHYYLFDADENSKSLTSAQYIYKSLLKEKFGRDTLLASVGGGTAGDIGGFVASTFMRGIQLVHIPTTLLASVDSSIGGKTGVNFSGAKNVIGTFYPPSLVLTDTGFFKTLPDDEVLSGTGEIIKYACLSGYEFYSYICSNLSSLLKLRPAVLNSVVSECIRLKAAVVMRDEFELTGLRKILNLGHTFAHAFESYFDFRLNHGKAVIAGLVAALFLSYRKKIINQSKLNLLLKLPLLVQNKKLITDYDSREVVRLMKADKKSKMGNLNFVLIKDLGSILVDIQARRDEIMYALNKTRELLL